MRGTPGRRYRDDIVDIYEEMLRQYLLTRAFDVFQPESCDTSWLRSHLSMCVYLISLHCEPSPPWPIAVIVLEAEISRGTTPPVVRGCLGVIVGWAWNSDIMYTMHKINRIHKLVTQLRRRRISLSLSPERDKGDQQTGLCACEY